MMKSGKRFLGRVCGRLTAGRRFCRVQSRYGSPPGRSFYSCKRNQNTLGAVPQDPLPAKLRLDTNDALASSVRRRRYALKVPAAHFMWGNCKPIAGSHAVETMGWISSYLSRRPLPRSGGGGRGMGQMRPQLPLERICAQYGFRFFFPEKSKSVASAAKRQEGLSRGKPGPP